MMMRGIPCLFCALLPCAGSLVVGSVDEILLLCIDTCLGRDLTKTGR